MLCNFMTNFTTKGSWKIVFYAIPDCSMMRKCADYGGSCMIGTCADDEEEIHQGCNGQDCKCCAPVEDPSSYIAICIITSLQ